MNLLGCLETEKIERPRQGLKHEDNAAIGHFQEQLDSYLCYLGVAFRFSLVRLAVGSIDCWAAFIGSFVVVIPVGPTKT